MTALPHRRFAVFALLGVMLVAAAGCGFRPLYGGTDSPFGGTAVRLNEVEIAVIPDRVGQKLRNLLIDRFYLQGRPATPVYRLESSLGITSTDVGLRADGSATRALMRVTAAYRLVDIEARKVVFTGQARSMIDYDIPDPQLAALVNERDAIDRGLVDLADEITTRVAVFVNQEL